MWVSPWPWTCLPAYFVDLDKGLRPVLPGGSVVHAVGKWICSPAVTALSVLVWSQSEVCVFALPVWSQVFSGRVLCTPPRLAFVSYHALGLHRGLAKAKTHGVCVCVLLYHCILGLVYNSFLDSSHNPVQQLMMSLPVYHPYTACTVCVFVLFAIMTKACLSYYAINLFFHKGCAGLPFLQPEKHYPR